MINPGYEILALFMRYVFVILLAVIVLRSYLWLRKDARMYRKEIRSLPDAGLVGEMVDMDTGESYPLPREGTLGASRGCDIRIRGSQLAGHHFNFLFVDGKGLTITPLNRQNVMLDGEMLFSTGCAVHGSRIEAGGVTLRVRLFAGLNVPKKRTFMQDEDEFEMDQVPSPFEEVKELLPHEDEEMQPYPQDEGMQGYNEYMPPQTYPEGMNPPGQMYQEYPAHMQGYPMPQNMQAAGNMQETWSYTPFPADMQEETQDDEEDYTPPFEQPERKRRGDRYL